MTAIAIAVLCAATAAAAEEHIVRSGETIAGLARLYYGDARQAPIPLAEANGLGTDARLSAGQRIRIPVPERTTVGPGESWATVAERTLGSARRGPILAKLNRKDPDRPPEQGSEVVIPIVLAHPVDGDETLAAIATRYYGTDRTAQRLLKEFNDLRGTRLPTRRPLLVPMPALRVSATGAEALEHARALRSDGPRARGQADIAAALPSLDVLFREGKYVELVSAASRLLGRAEASGNQLVSLNRLLGYAYVALERNDLAVEAFREALRRQPDLELNPITTSPKILRVFRQAQRALQGAPGGHAPR